MATDAQNLVTIKSNLIAALLTESANPKPTYSIDGQSISWDDYRTSLLNQIATIDQLMAAATGPWEVSIQGMP